MYKVAFLPPPQEKTDRHQNGRTLFYFVLCGAGGWVRHSPRHLDRHASDLSYQAHIVRQSQQHTILHSTSLGSLALSKISPVWASQMAFSDTVYNKNQTINQCATVLTKTLSWNMPVKRSPSKFPLYYENGGVLVHVEYFRYILFIHTWLWEERLSVTYDVLIALMLKVSALQECDCEIVTKIFLFPLLANNKKNNASLLTVVCCLT